MAIDFPPLIPSDRNITQGDFPVKRQVSPGGTGASKRFGTVPRGLIIELEFSNITDLDAFSLGLAHQLAFGSYEPLALPHQFWNDITEPLRSRLKRNYTWRFAESPVYSKSSIPGFKNVKIKLKGDFDYSPPPPYIPPLPEPGLLLPTEENPEILDGLWDLRFDEKQDTLEGVGRNEFGQIAIWPPGSGIIQYPESFIEGPWRTKFIGGATKWWHVPTGWTENVWAAESQEVPSVGQLGINAITTSFPNGISSTGQEFKNAAYGSPYGPWRRNTGYSTIRNLGMRRANTGGPWIPYSPPLV
jgi:hypothetical protein